MENIKNCQPHLLFYHSPNKIFLKIAPKPIALLELVNISLIYNLNKKSFIWNKTFNLMFSCLKRKNYRILLEYNKM